MERKYIDISQFTTIGEIIDRNFTLSATQYKTFCIKNNNQKEVRELLDRKISFKDKGNDPGSESYVEFSKYKFIKTKCLQKESYLLDETKDSTEFLSPLFFNDSSLKRNDILISNDSNVGEIIILDKDYPNSMLCGGIYKLPITKYKLYFLAFAKSDLFRQQIDFLVPRGATIRHGKEKFLDCKIPFPNTNVNETIDYVESIVQAIINKESLIKEKHEKAMNEIEYELQNNQSPNMFSYKLPSISEIMDLDRMDSCLYSKEFKKEEFLIRNYIHGVKTIKQLGFFISRGQNLQVSNIGKSIQVKEKRDGYYTLILPKYLSKYGTIKEVQYIGNNMPLKTLKVGDVIFGAEGNEKGRSLVVLEEKEMAITNIHGITLNQNSHDKTKSVFVKLFLDYYRKKGMIDAYAVGGNGGSMAIKYWDYLKFPNFPSDVEERIVNLYTSQTTYSPQVNCIKDFIEYDEQFNENAGIHELSLSVNYLKILLDNVINDIADDKIVEIKY